MINITKKTSLLIAISLVSIIGIAIISMLLFEHQRALQLVEKNRILMKNTALKTLNIQLNKKQLTYPQSVDEINRTWNHLTSKFIAFSNNQRVYPDVFEGLNSEKISPLWSIYETLNIDHLDKSLVLSNESQLRIKAIHDIEKELTNKLSNKQSSINSKIEHYLTLIENHQLSPLEEIISALKFLQLKKDSRWNDQLIKLFIFTGSHKVTALSKYLFKENKDFTKKDTRLIMSELKSILEITQLDLTWFNEKTHSFWDSSINFSSMKISDGQIIQNKWFAIKNQNSFVLLIPFDIKKDLRMVEETLKRQSVLEKSDRIIFSQNNYYEKSVLLKNLTLEVNRSEWESEVESINKFLIIKLLIAISFILSILTILFFVNSHISRKLKYIELRNNFLNLVSHELKTPLASIRIMTETLSKRYSKNLSIKDYPDKIVNEVDHLWLMVDNLLSLNQIRSGEFQINKDRVLLSSMIERIQKKMPVKSSRKIVVSNTLPKDYYWYVDPMLFEIVLANLFSNAIKYCTNNEVSISIYYDPSKKHVLFKDNACGIKQEYWHRIFDDFFRIQTTNNQQGSGVGLSLCKQIMKFHHGSIEITKSSTSGTIWRLKLPTN